MPFFKERGSLIKALSAIFYFRANYFILFNDNLCLLVTRMCVFCYNIKSNNISKN